MNLVAGQRTRAAIAWSTSPAYWDYIHRPDADLDLRILGPNGQLVASSSSYDNTYEVVDFTPTVNGTYRMVVNKFRCDHSDRWFGFAWHRGKGLLD